MKTEEIDLATYRRLTQAVPRKRAKQAPRADIPRAGRAESTGLTPLLVRGWSVQTPDCVRYRLYQIHTGLDTGLCADLKSACDKAKMLSRNVDFAHQEAKDA